MQKNEQVEEEVIVSVFEGLNLCLYCPKSTDVDTADNILHVTAESWGMQQADQEDPGQG